MSCGKIVEIGQAEMITENPLHPYTKALVAAVPEPDPSKRPERRDILVKGEISSTVDLPSGCRFHPRCLYEKELCREVEPQLVQVKPGCYVACHNIKTEN